MFVGILFLLLTHLSLAIVLSLAFSLFISLLVSLVILVWRYRLSAGFDWRAKIDHYCCLDGSFLAGLIRFFPSVYFWKKRRLELCFILFPLLIYLWSPQAWEFHQFLENPDLIDSSMSRKEISLQYKESMILNRMIEKSKQQLDQGFDEKIQIDVQSGNDLESNSSRSVESQIKLKRRGIWPLAEPYELEI